MDIEFQSTLPVWGATGVFCFPAGSERISIHAPRVGSDPSTAGRPSSDYYFNPRSPCGERQWVVCGWLVRCINFNPRSPCGERRACARRATTRHTPFQSTLPVWGATMVTSGSDLYRGFQSTLPVWGATTDVRCDKITVRKFQSTLPVWGATGGHIVDHVVGVISIHAPRVGSDRPGPAGPPSPGGISIHAPRVGSDGSPGDSTNPGTDFNPRSPCGERRTRRRRSWSRRRISIHAPRVGSDLGSWRRPGNGPTFQSTLPVWGATRSASNPISGVPDFNPRSPCGERLACVFIPPPPQKFQSTLPVWGATFWLLPLPAARGNFNPRSPCGERLPLTWRPDFLFKISIHAPRVGSDLLL